MIFVAHNMMIISRTPKIFIFCGLPRFFMCKKKKLIELLHRCMKWTFPPKENALIIWITTYIQKFRGFWPTAGLWRPNWNSISTDLDVGFDGGWGNNPRGSSRRLLLITASFTGSDTEIDGAGKIGLAVEGNKDPLDKNSEEALVLSDSANFFLTWPEDISEGLSPLLFPRLNRIIDRCCAVEFSKISLNFLKTRKGRWGAPGRPDPEIRRRPGLPKKFFGPSGLSLV